MEIRKLPLPTNQRQEVLYLLLKNTYGLTRVFFTNKWILNAPTRICELRRLGVDIINESHKTKNKFNRSVSYDSYKLADYKKAREYYISLHKTK